MRCSLWLVPDHASAPAYAALIAAFADRLGGPRFPPHLTLIGGIEDEPARAVERCARLAAAIAPWSAMPVGLGFGLSRHQCVFALLRPDPALVRARRLTCEAFAREEATFMPHVSLAYGPIDDAARARIDADRPELPRFACDALALWATGGDEAGWREVGRAALGG